MNQINQLRQLIRESIQEYIREVETSGNIAAQEAKIRACEEAIALREKKINLEGLDETMHEMIDQSKLNELKKEVKELQKYKTKAEKVLDKMKMKAEGKAAPKKMEDEGMDDETEEGIVDEVNLDEYTTDPAGSELEEGKKMTAAQKDKKEDIVKGMKKSKSFGKSKEDKSEMYATATKLAMKENKQFLHMQKLAGLITETQYNEKMQMLSEGLSSNKVQMLLNKLAKLIPGQEQEFLEFMAKTANSAMDYSGSSTDELAQNFIDFEESENEEEFTPEVMNDVLKMYIPAFKRGDGTF